MDQWLRKGDHNRIRLEKVNNYSNKVKLVLDK